MGARPSDRLWHLARACLSRVVLTGSAVAAAMARAAPAQVAPASHLWAWGNGDGGQLGIGTPGVRITPVPVHGLGTSPVRQVVAPNLFGPVVDLEGGTWFAAV